MVSNTVYVCKYYFSNENTQNLILLLFFETVSSNLNAIE